MDITKIKDDSNSGKWVKVFLPNGIETDIEIKIAGKNSYRYSNAKRQLNLFAIEENVDRSKPEWDEKANMMFYKAVIIDWKNVEENGKVLECNEPNIEKVLTQLPFIIDQLEAKIYNVDFFIELSKES